MSLEELVELYTNWQRSLGRSEALFVHLRLAFTGFASQVPTEDVRALTSRHLAAYQAWLQQQQQLVPTTRYRRWRIVYCLLRWAVQRQYLLLHPGEGLEMRKPEAPLPRALWSQEQVRKLLECPSPYTVMGQRDRFLWELLYGTGLRRREMVRLDVEDYVRETSSLRVRQGKNRKDRFVPLGDHLIGLMEHYLLTVRPALNPGPGQVALLIDSQGGRRLCHNTLHVRLRHYLKRLGWKSGSLHALRHAYATHLLQNGARLEEVRALLGHTQVTTTMIYTHIQPEELLRMYRHTHPRARRRCRSAKTS